MNEQSNSSGMLVRELFKLLRSVDVDVVEFLRLLQVHGIVVVVIVVVYFK